jgi:hypothetical protein
MTQLFESGRILDVILALVVLEAIGLLLWYRLTGHGPKPRDILPTLISGLMLMLALRAAIADLQWELVALPLTFALVAHLSDLAIRWRTEVPNAVPPLPSPAKRKGSRKAAQNPMRERR